MVHRRTQKTSKHKKIKACDPFYSGPRRTAQFKADKDANKAPGEQKMPRKLLDMMERKKQMQLPRSKSKSRNKFRQGSTNDSTPVEFKQKKYETVSKFCRRMDKVAREAITKAELEVQFDVQFERQGKDKLIVSTSQKQAPLEDNRRRKFESTTDAHADLTKSQKRRTKEVTKREEKRLDRVDEFGEMIDHVEFGEVVEAPPEIKSAPRKAPEVKRMGEKALLLRRVLEPEPEEIPHERSLFDPIPDATVLRVAKARKEERRLNAVQAYRHLKKQNASKRPTAEFN